SKEPHPPKWTGYQLLALIFGTLLSSQGTDASFVLTLSGFPPGASFVLVSPTLSDSFVSDSRSKRVSLSRSFAFALFLFGDFDSIRSFPPDFPASDL
ncbi:hypothetical protein, partial [Streptomyces sp. NPDC060031]|uniref:hypothetical protein n=1 Tax=Streptomyces sp. NPDC060031 TaxID=3347043 RepID=UPI0036AFD531